MSVHFKKLAGLFRPAPPPPAKPVQAAQNPVNTAARPAARGGADTFEAAGTSPGFAALNAFAAPARQTTPVTAPTAASAESAPAEPAATAVPLSEEDEAALDALGIAPDELPPEAEVVAELIAAGRAVIEGDEEAALAHLTAAWELAGPQVEALVTRAAEKLPEPLRAVLSNPEIVHELFVGAPEVLQTLLFGRDPIEAIAQLASMPELRDEVLAIAAEHEPLASALSALGLDVADLQAAGEALPELLRALGAASEGNWEQAIVHLQAALPALEGTARTVAENALLSAANKLPAEHPARAYLTDPAVVSALVAAGPDAVAKLLEGDVLGALELLGTDEALRTAVLDVARNDATVTGPLAAIGLTVDDLLAAGDSVGDLARAARAAANGEYDLVAQALADAAANGGAELASKVIAHFAANLPEGPARALLSDPALVAKLLEGGTAVLAKLLSDDPAAAIGAVRDLLTDPELAAVVAQNPWVQEQLAALGLSAEDLTSASAALPHLLDAVLAAEAGDWVGVVNALGLAAGESADVAAKALAHLAAQHFPEGHPLRTLLADTTLTAALLSAGGDVLAALQSGDLPALMDAVKAAWESNPELKDAFTASPAVREFLTGLGVPEELIDEALAVAPTLIEVAQAAADGDWEAVFAGLREIAGDLPQTLGLIGQKLAEKIPPGGVNDAIRALLSDGDFLAQVLGDERLHGQLAALFSGDASKVMTAVKALLEDPTIGELASEVIWAKWGDRLTALGLQGPEDIRELIVALPDLLSAAEHAAQGHWEEAWTALQAAAGKVSPELLRGVFDRIVEKLPDSVPAHVKALLKAGFALAATPEGREALSGLFRALSANPPDIDGFMQAIGTLGGIVGTLAKEDQKAILDALGALPGNIGALFRDTTLNQAIVESGALGTVFAAVQELLDGDVVEAVKKLGEAAVQLLGYPESERIGGLPLTAEGLQNFARLFQALFNSLPNAVKAKVEAAVASATGSLLGFIPFIGDAIDTGRDIKELFDEIKAGDKEGIALAIAQLGVDAAEWTQLGKPFVAPLEIALSILQTVEDVGDTVDEMRDQFRDIMVTGNDPDEYEPMTPDERRALAEAVGYAENYGMSPLDAAELIKDPAVNGDPRRFQAAVEAAQRLGVPPELFAEFFAVLKTEVGALEADLLSLEGKPSMAMLEHFARFCPQTLLWILDHPELGVLDAALAERMGTQWEEADAEQRAAWVAGFEESLRQHLPEQAEAA